MSVAAARGDVDDDGHRAAACAGLREVVGTGHIGRQGKGGGGAGGCGDR